MHVSWSSCLLSEHLSFQPSELSSFPAGLEPGEVGGDGRKIPSCPSCSNRALDHWKDWQVCLWDIPPLISSLLPASLLYPASLGLHCSGPAQAFAKPVCAEAAGSEHGTPCRRTCHGKEKPEEAMLKPIAGISNCGVSGLLMSAGGTLGTGPMVLPKISQLCNHQVC